MTREQRADSFTQERVDVMRRASELTAAGVPFVLATVVRVEPPSSARPGNRAIVYPDGTIEGWIGGGCATPTTRREALAAFADGESRVVRITPDVRVPAPSGVKLAPMSCASGGTVEMWIEPFLPPPVLVVGGESPVAAALQKLGASLGFRVVQFGRLAGDAVESVDDIRMALTSRLPGSPNETWLVAVSHGDFDDELIEAGIRLGYRYVGLVASQRRSDTVRVRLHQHGLSGDALGTFRPSAGLRIGAKTPDEIALAVMAEIVSLRRTAAVSETCRASPAAALDDVAPCCHGVPETV